MRKVQRALVQAALIVMREVGAEEIFTTLGFVALGWGLWGYSPALAAVTIGAIVVWWALPPRPPFIDRPAPPPSRGRKE